MTPNPSSALRALAGHDTPASPVLTHALRRFGGALLLVLLGAATPALATPAFSVTLPASYAAGAQQGDQEFIKHARPLPTA